MSIFIIINGLLFLFIVAVATYIEIDKRKIKRIMNEQQNTMSKTHDTPLDQ